ncbi:glutamine--fructose-6-phosphate transaminase (isomerizing) [Methanogenium sp. MK-MG]|uniref:glutamine--fructose-6-phosphate transaminase (isomerizing) n=1 Tax=Methanogenium sp. MK-MG TaxID=2599926 RepID=UPI0013EBB286|nr:glutamine--fructose-6-phosphate transaminase (isomerizing) [Methanogenium sp. MK-MG]KAF1078954.1 Glutamine--fructose-6-phosphate aminotransferase (isomerizing) [Methanogenium sp. MK-MG]
MCGIVGYIGWREAAPVLVGGLKSLEYRGYDSFGVATGTDSIMVAKRKGRISEQADCVSGCHGTRGIGHTRWATHGLPDDRNAHPHTDCTGQFAIVHNGIIENYAELRRGLEGRCHRFTSDTDSEVIAHLIEEAWEGDFAAAVRAVLPLLEGSYAILAVCAGSDEVIAARERSPLVIGLGDDEFFACSDSTPIVEYTRNIMVLEDGDLVVMRRGAVAVENGGETVVRETTYIDYDIEASRKGGFEHFMLKEIFEQPDVFQQSFRLACTHQGISMLLSRARGVSVIACGTSYNAALLFRYFAEKECGVPVRVDLASEYRYLSTPDDEIVIAVSQSGETADTLSALKKAVASSCPTIAITNVQGSSITRAADHTIYTGAGPEISVAATKSYMGQFAAFVGLLAGMNCSDMSAVERSVRQVIEESLLTDVSEAVSLCAKASTIFYVGRGIFYPVALEGALKMKEISYIHAEGYAAGEIKHGPFALLSEETPAVAVCMPGDGYQSMLGNLREMKARGTPLIGIGYGDDIDLQDVADVCIPVPKGDAYAQVAAVTVIMQRIAYYTALALGQDIDKPRNLAKSVTVE